MNRWLAINVLHILDHSLPEQSGYAYRSHAILCELQRHGTDIAAITGPKQGVADAPINEIDEIRYERTPLAAGKSTSGPRGQIRTVAMTRNQIREAKRSKSWDLIHAHSPCLNGLAALRLGLPVLYEMRSSWEDAAVSVGTTTYGSLRYKLSRALETFVVRKAAAIVVICEGLKDELISRGIPEPKITVVPNALPPEMFEQADRSSIDAVRQKYNLAGAQVIGFFGSFFEWEGVDELVVAMPEIIQSVPGAHLLLAGGGRQESAIRDLVATLGLSERVTLAGRISHDDVKAFYGAADVMAYPRVSDRLTNMVTPIKPLEAMAQEAIVVASDVGGHRELVRHNETGYLYQAGDRRAFVTAISTALTSTDQNSSIRKEARRYVREHRRWSVVSRRYLPLYDELRRTHG